MSNYNKRSGSFSDNNLSDLEFENIQKNGSSSQLGKRIDRMVRRRKSVVNNAAKKIGKFMLGNYYKRKIPIWKEKFDRFQEEYLKSRRGEIYYSNENEKIHYEHSLKINLQDLYFKLYRRDYDEDLILQHQAFEEVIERANNNNVSLNDIEDYLKDVDVIYSGIKEIKFNNNKYVMNIFKYKGKNKECRNKWVLYWDKRENGIGIKYVDWDPNQRVAVRDENGQYVKPDFKERNIFYLQVLDYPEVFPVNADFDVKYEYNNQLMNKTANVDKNVVNEKKDIMMTIGWGGSGGYVPNNHQTRIIN